MFSTYMTPCVWSESSRGKRHVQLTPLEHVTLSSGMCTYLYIYIDFLAYLVTRQLISCHHFASVVHLSYKFHMFSETTRPIGNKPVRNDVYEVLDATRFFNSSWN